jgi:hypothetical protein
MFFGANPRKSGRLKKYVDPVRNTLSHLKRREFRAFNWGVVAIGHYLVGKGGRRYPEPTSD